MGILCMFCALVPLLAVAPTFSEGTGCENATSPGSENEAWVYTCNSGNKKITIKWIKQDGNIQRVLSTCEGSSTTCLNADPSVLATRSEDGKSELRITSSCNGQEYNSTIECHEVINSLETGTHIKVEISRDTSSTRRSAKITTSVHNASTPTAASKGENSSVSRGQLGNLSHATSGQFPVSGGEGIEISRRSPTMVVLQGASGMSGANGRSTASLLATSTENPVTGQTLNSSNRTMKEILSPFTSTVSLTTMSEGIPFTKEIDNKLNTITSLEKETLGEKTNPTVSFTPDTNRTSDDTVTPLGNPGVQAVSSSTVQPHIVSVSPVTDLKQPTGNATVRRESSEVTTVGLAYSGSPKVTEETGFRQTDSPEMTATTWLNPSESSEEMSSSWLTQQVSSEITGVTGSAQDGNYQVTASTGLNYKSGPNVTVSNGLTHKHSSEITASSGLSPEGGSQATMSLEPRGSVSSAQDSSLNTNITEIPTPTTIVSVTQTRPTEWESAGLEATFLTESDASQSPTDVPTSSESSLVTSESQGNASSPTPSVDLRTSVYVTTAAEVQSPSGMTLGSISMTDGTADARDTFTQSLVSRYTSSTRSPVEETESSINISPSTATPTKETSSVSPLSSNTTSEGIAFTKDSDNELNSVTFLENETLGEKTNPTVSFTRDTNRTSDDTVTPVGNPGVQAVSSSTGQPHIVSVSPVTDLDRPTSNATLRKESFEVTTVGLAYSGGPKITKETRLSQTGSSEMTGGPTLNTSERSDVMASSWFTQKVSSEITGVTGSVQEGSYEVTTSTGLNYKNSPNVTVTAELTYENNADVTGSTGLNHKSSSNITEPAESTYGKSSQVTAATGSSSKGSSQATTSQLTYKNSSQVTEYTGLNHNSSSNITVTAELTYDNSFEETAATGSSQKVSSDDTTFVEPSASVTSAQDSSLNTMINDIRTQKMLVSVSEEQVVTSAKPTARETSEPEDTVHTESDASQSPTDVPTSTESLLVMSENRVSANTPTPSVDLHTSVYVTIAAEVQSPSGMTLAPSSMFDVTADTKDTFTQSPVSTDLSSTRSPVDVTDSSLKIFTSSATPTNETNSVSRDQLGNQSHTVSGQANNTEIPASSEEGIENSSQSPTAVRRQDVSGMSEAPVIANGMSTESILTTRTDNLVNQQKSNSSLQTMTGTSAPVTSFVSLSMTSEGFMGTKDTEEASNTVTFLEKETLSEKTNPTVSFTFDSMRTSDDTVTYSGNPGVQAVSSSTDQPHVVTVSPVTDLEQPTGNATLRSESSEVTTVGLAYSGSPKVTDETEFRQSDSSEMTATTWLNPSENSEEMASSWLTQKVSSEITVTTGSAQEGAHQVTTSTGLNYKNILNVTVTTELTYENSSQVTASTGVNHNSSSNVTVTAGLTYDNSFEATAATDSSPNGSSSDDTTFVEPSASVTSAQDSSLNTMITDIRTQKLLVSVSEEQVVTSAKPTVRESSEPEDIVHTESDTSHSPTDVPTSTESSLVTSESQGNANTPTPSVDLRTSVYVTTAAEVQSPSAMTLASSSMSDVTADERNTFNQSPDLSSTRSPVDVTDSSLNVFTPSATPTDETSSVSRDQLGNQSHTVSGQANNTEIPASSEEAIENFSQSPTMVRHQDVSGMSEALPSANDRSTESLLTTSTDNPVTEKKSNSSYQTMTGISAPVTSFVSLSITSEGFMGTKDTDETLNTVPSLEKETLGEKTNPTVSLTFDTNRTSDDTVTHSGNPDVQAVSTSTGQPPVVTVSPVTDLEQPTGNATLRRESSEVTTVGLAYSGSPKVTDETEFRPSDSSEMTATTWLNPSESSEVMASSWLTQKVSSVVTVTTGSAQEGDHQVTTSTSLNYKNIPNVTVTTELTYENSSQVTASTGVNHNSSSNVTVTAGLTYDNSFEATAATDSSPNGSSSDATTFVEPSASVTTAQDSSLNTMIIDIRTQNMSVSVSEGQVVTSTKPTGRETSEPEDIVHTESDASQSPTDVSTSTEKSLVTSESQGNTSTPTRSVDLGTSVYVTTAAEVQSPSGMPLASSSMSDTTADARDTFTQSPVSIDTSSTQRPVEEKHSSPNVFTPSVTPTDETSSVYRDQLDSQSHKVSGQANRTEFTASSGEAIENFSQSPTMVRHQDVSGMSEATASANGMSTESVLTTSTDNPVTQKKSNSSYQTMTGNSAPFTSFVSLSITSEGIMGTKDTDKALNAVTTLENETLGEKTNPTVSFTPDTNLTSANAVTHSGNHDIQAVSSSNDQPHVVTVSPVTDLDQPTGSAPLRSESSEVTTVELAYSSSPKVTDETGLRQSNSSEVTETTRLNPSESSEVMTLSRLTQKVISEVTGVTGLVQEASTGLNYKSNPNVTGTNGLTYKHSSDVTAATDTSPKGSFQAATSLNPSGSMISTQDRSLNTEITDIETQTILISVSEGQVVTSAKTTGRETSEPEDTVGTESGASQRPIDVLTSSESWVVTSESQDKPSTPTGSVDLRTSEYVTTAAEVLSPSGMTLASSSMSDYTVDVRDTFTQSPDSRSLTPTQRTVTATAVSSRVDGAVSATDSEITPPPTDSTPKDAHYVINLTVPTENASSLTTEDAAVQSQTVLSNTFAIDSASSAKLANRTPYTSETISTTAAANNQSQIYTTQENTTQNKFVTTETPSTRVQEYTSAVTLSSLLRNSLSFNTLHGTDVTFSDSSWKSSEKSSNDNTYTALSSNQTSASVPGSPFSAENMQGTESTVKRNFHQTSATPTSSQVIPSGHTLIETTLGSSPETHDTSKGTSVAVIAGVVSAVVVSLVVMGTAYIFVRKRRMKSITLSHDLSKNWKTGYIYYGDFSLGSDISDDVEKGRRAQEFHRRDFDMAKSKELVELRTYRSLTPSQTCVLLEEIESPYSAHIADAHSVGTRSIHSVSNGRPPQPMPGAFATDDTQNDKPEIYAVTNITGFQLSSCEQVSRTQERSDEKDDGYFPDDESESPCSIRKADTVGFSSGGGASRARFPTDSKASEDSGHEDSLSATYAAINTLPKPSRSRGDAAKSTDCLGLGDKNKNESDPIYATVNKPKKQTGPVEDYVYASVNKILPKPKEESRNKN